MESESLINAIFEEGYKERIKNCKLSMLNDFQLRLEELKKSDFSKVEVIRQIEDYILTQKRALEDSYWSFSALQRKIWK